MTITFGLFLRVFLHCSSLFCLPFIKDNVVPYRHISRSEVYHYRWQRLYSLLDKTTCLMTTMHSAKGFRAILKTVQPV